MNPEWCNLLLIFFLFSSLRNDSSYKSSISRSRQKTGRWLQSFGTAINHHDVLLLCWQVGSLFTCLDLHGTFQRSKPKYTITIQTLLSRKLHQTELNYHDTHNLRLTWAASREKGHWWHRFVWWPVKVMNVNARCMIHVRRKVAYLREKEQ